MWYTRKGLLMTILAFLITIISCQTKQDTYERDLNFLKEHTTVVELVSDGGLNRLVIAPELQSRVLTSTCSGMKGPSFGTFNRDRFEIKENDPHANGYGGEERLWLGPLGSQFSLFFIEGKELSEYNWHVPAPFDRESFKTIYTNETEAHFRKEMYLKNYIGTEFHVMVDRKIEILDRDRVKAELKIDLPPTIQVSGFQSTNTMVNKGESWSLKSGVLNIWLLNQYQGNDQTVVVIPLKRQTSIEEINQYLSNVDHYRLQIKDGSLLYRGDGRFRNKIGTTDLMTSTIMGAYDGKNNQLTLTKFLFDRSDSLYFNSINTAQENPYVGDLVNIYNNGPGDYSLAEKNSFYEMESWTPAKVLIHGENTTHVNQTFHFTGSTENLKSIVQQTLRVSLSDIEAFAERQKMKNSQQTL